MWFAASVSEFVARGGRLFALGLDLSGVPQRSVLTRVGAP